MILLVEDNPDDEALALRALRKTLVRDEVRVARTGQQALEEIDRLPPRLILLDLKLPLLDGHAVLTAIRQRPATRYVPVVVMTSSTEAADVERAYQLGANSYIQKPVDFLQFVEATRRIGEYWLELNRAPLVTASTGDDSDGQGT